MGIFSGLFSGGGVKDLSAVGADMHSHLIPGIDDGAKEVEDSVEMIEGLIELGFSSFMGTPHVMADHYRNSTDTIRRGADEVREALQKKGINVPFSCAAEYYADEELEKRIESKDLLSFGDNYVLFEVSYVNRSSNMEKTIFDLKMKGYKPVLAHPERYTFMYQDFEAYERLYANQVDFQINLASLAGYYSPAAKKIAEKLIKNEMVDWIGTDIHNPRHLTPLKKALQSKALKNLIESGRLKNANLL